MRHRGVQQDDFADYCEQLARLLESEVGLHESLQLLQHGWERRAMQQLADGVCRSVGEGRTLADALAQNQQYLPPFLVEVIRRGERDGNLAETLADIAAYLQVTAPLDTGRSSELRATLYYPAAVFGVMVVITAVLMIFVIPQFKVLFDNFGANLPALTLLIIDIADVVTAWWAPMALLLLIVGVGWRYGMHHLPIFQRLNIHLLSLLPGYGTLYLQGNAARLLHTWGFLLGRGMDMGEAVAASAQLPLGPYYQGVLREAAAQMRHGKRLENLLARELMPVRMSRVLAVASRIREPQQLLRRIADGYTLQVQKRIKWVAARQEIILITLIALVIGTLVIAMYLPIFMLGEVV